MSRNEINSLRKAAEGLRDLAGHMIKQVDRLPPHEFTRWMKLYLVKKAEVEFWANVKADDE